MTGRRPPAATMTAARLFFAAALLSVSLSCPPAARAESADAEARAGPPGSADPVVIALDSVTMDSPAASSSAPFAGAAGRRTGVPARETAALLVQAVEANAGAAACSDGRGP